MQNSVKESDWRVFRNRLAGWRERYLTTVTAQLADLLRDEDQTPTERFWEAKDRIHEEARILRDCLDGSSRSKMG
ncbi:MAG: hypothetical protein GVY12_04360 [Bacteroidetes bacterium]|nr:hypothetical protein [Bacteroidota bacterium]